MSVPLPAPARSALPLRSQAEALASGAQRTGSRGVIGPPTLLCASGRGGSGTTLVAALLAAAAAGEGYRVLLIDADDLAGPLTIMLDAKPMFTWLDLRGGRVTPEDVATPLNATLTVVAGGVPRLAGQDSSPLNSTERKACFRRLGGLTEGKDLIVIDCGSRLETVLAAITPHSGERLVAITASPDAVGLASTYALCKAVGARFGSLPVELLVNRLEESEATRCFDAVDAGARQFLGLPLRLAGIIPADPTLGAALSRGMAFADAAVGSPAAVAAHAIVMQSLANRSHSRSGA